MKKFYLIFPFLTLLLSCEKDAPSIDKGNFIGEWYVLNFEDGKEHWKIDNKNNVFSYNKNGEITGHYFIKNDIYWTESYPETLRVLYSYDEKDTIGIDWIETPTNFPTEIPQDTIRFYHGPVMVRNNKFPDTDLTKKEIVQFFNNSFWEYQLDDVILEFYLSDSLVNRNEKLAYVKMRGCREASSSSQSWTLDTLTNNLVFSFTTGGWNEKMLIKEINQNEFIADIDHFYWFRKNKIIKRDTSWNFSILQHKDYKHHYLRKGC